MKPGAIPPGWEDRTIPYPEPAITTSQAGPPGRHLHLDAVGGVAGDMFVAALLDAFPDLQAAMLAAALHVSGVDCQRIEHREASLCGARFVVTAPHHEHGHVRWRDIRARIRQSDLTGVVQRHAIGIFTLLAQAEARVHGIEPDAVAFHEVGAADSIADIVAAAWLIDAVSPAGWSVGPLPLGSGIVRTAHGDMPVPAPATALLLEGMALIDDGIAGERVTPTGAAILRYLSCAGTLPAPGRLTRSGMGFGTRRLPGRGNFLRVMAFDLADAPIRSVHRELLVVAFEVDDQSPEDLAIGLDRLRGLASVHDALQMPAVGKKGRMTVHVQVLADPHAIDEVVESCFRETTTIGLRTQIVQARALSRRMHDVMLDGAAVRVKRVARPGGATGKMEADDLISRSGHAARAALRRRAELLAEEQDDA